MLCLKKVKDKYYIDDKIVEDETTLYRIKKLGIPNWKDTQVSKSPNSYLQVTGLDSKNRKQYIYHPVFIELTTNEKFNRIKNFCTGLPIFLKMVNKKLKSKENKCDKEYIICLMFKILNKTYLRVGNCGQSTYGLTTLEKRHVKLISPDTIIFDFIGKKGVKNHKEINDELIYNNLSLLTKDKKETEKIFTADREIGQAATAVTSLDLNAYIQKNMALEFSCKDFRTYYSNILFIKFLSSGHSIKDSYDKVAAELCHTKNISKKSYVANKIEEKFKTSPELFNKKTIPEKIFLSL